MHKPVLLNEVINFLDPQPGEFIIDGTFGSGGHAQEILKKLGPDGKLLGVDWDEQSFSVHAISDSRFSYEVANYSDLSEILKNPLAGRQVKHKPEIVSLAQHRINEIKKNKELRLRREKRIKSNGLQLA